jgi:hypothetical protein
MQLSHFNRDSHFVTMRTESKGISKVYFIYVLLLFFIILLLFMYVFFIYLFILLLTFSVLVIMK